MTNMMIKKTIKLFIGGKFPRTESGRSYPVKYAGTDKVYAYICQASRKDLRLAVEEALKAADAWTKTTAYNRAQILYRMAEMMEGKRAEFNGIFKDTLGFDDKQANQEVDQAIDALVFYAGFADKFSQISATLNPVQSSLHNFTFPEPVGLVGLIEDQKASFAKTCADIAAIICSGNCVVALLNNRCPAVLSALGEVMATSDLPAGVVNLLTGYVEELHEPMASHMEIRSLSIQDTSSELLAKSRLLATENMKRVVGPLRELQALKNITEFVEYKTTWHPVGF